MMLRKGVKSLQLSLNEFIPLLDLDTLTVSNAAYSKARHKFRHTAFLALNRTAVVETMYEDGDYETFRGLRILGVDGSLIRLPENPETAKEFGTIPYPAGHPASPDEVQPGTHTFARASTLYDVLNHIALDAVLASSSSYEVDLAVGHLAQLQAGDLCIYDRGYCSYRMIALAIRAKGDFLIRCPKGRFPQATAMLQGEVPDDVVTELTAPKGFTDIPTNQDLPGTVTVRFVRVILDSGDVEVLVTSLLDQKHFPLTIFKELYYLRWGIETFYGIVKTRLGLENFSGNSPEAVRQDFAATIFLTGVESIFTEDVEATLAAQTGGYPKKVNKAVSFNAIKNQAFTLFMSNQPEEEVLTALDALFLTSPTIVRKGRKPPRVNHGNGRLLDWWKRRRKGVF
jgi:hypothetical protein